MLALVNAHSAAALQYGIERDFAAKEQKVRSGAPRRGARRGPFGGGGRDGGSGAPGRGAPGRLKRSAAVVFLPLASRAHRAASRAQVVFYDMGSGSTEVALVKYSTYSAKEPGSSKPKAINQFEVRVLVVGLVTRSWCMCVC